jgi:predicted nuclease with TOPRIM domain
MEGRLEDVIEESSRAFDAIESRLNLTIERDRTTASQLGTLNTSIQSIQRQLTRLNESASDYDNMIASIDSRVSELQAKLEQQSEDATASELSQPVSTPVRNAPSPERYAGTLQYCVLTAITGTAYVKSRRTGSAVRLERGTRLIGYGRITEIRANGDIVTRNPVNGSQMLVQRSCNY